MLTIDRKVKVCAVQPKPRTFAEDPANVDHALMLMDQAAKEQPDIICFPELFPYWDSDLICQKAGEIKSYLIYGIQENISPTQYFVTSKVLDRNGCELGRQRKNHRAPGVESHLTYEGTKLFEADFGRFGVQICIDGWGFPEGINSLAQMGAEIIFNPSLIFLKLQQQRMAMLARVMDYQIPLVVVNNAECSFRRKAEDKGFPPAGGGSFIVAPPTELVDLEQLMLFTRRDASTEKWIISQASEEEEILTVTLDLGVLAEVRKAWKKYMTDNE